MIYNVRSSGIIETLARFRKTTLNNLKAACIKNGSLEKENETDYRVFDCFFEQGCGILQLTLKENDSKKDFLMYKRDLDRLGKDFPKDVPEPDLIPGFEKNKLLIGENLSLDFLVQKNYMMSMDSAYY